jgi:hypothetical protein
MHTMAKVKNDALADGDTPEPVARVIGEEQVVAAADMLIANTDDEARSWSTCYDADPAGSRWCTPASTSTCSARLAGAGAQPARLAPDATCSSSSAGSSR